MIEQLQFRLPGPPYPSYLTWKGFVLVFHHAFWQAVYHALVASLAHADSPSLWVVFGDTGCSIYNREHPLIRESAKRKALDNRFLDDRIFFNRLEGRLDGRLGIRGPRESGDRPGTWETIIDVRRTV